MRRTLQRGVLAAAGTLLAAGISRKYLTPGAEAQPEPGRPPVQPIDVVRAHAPTAVPPLSFIDADDHALTLEEIRTALGGGLVLNFWATWCVPCVAEMPALDALSRNLAHSGVTVLTVSVDHGGADQVRAFFTAHQIRSLPVLLDPHSTSLAALGVSGIPTTLLINKAGQEVARVSGSVDWAAPQAASLVTRLAS